MRSQQGRNLACDVHLLMAHILLVAHDLDENVVMRIAQSRDHFFNVMKLCSQPGLMTSRRSS